MSEIRLTIHPFEMDTLKEAAKKVQEEAGETFAEYAILQEQKDRSTASLADEIADTIQAACNLASRYNIDLQAAMERCERSNRSRGRYQVEEVKNAEPIGACGSDDCNCGGDCGAMSAGMGVLWKKSPEEMSATELIETLKATNSFACRKILCDDWCNSHYNCETCRNRLLDLLSAAHKREVASHEYEKSFYKEKIEAYDDDVRRRITYLTHERDRLRRRLEELSEAGITELHRLLREAAGEAKNVTDNARVYIDKQKGSNDEQCGDCGSIGRNHGVDCGAERVEERVLSDEPPAQEMSERENVVERLRGYDVYMTEPPSKNANRLFACITGNKDAEIACGNDIEAVRDKLIKLLSYEKVPDGE